MYFKRKDQFFPFKVDPFSEENYCAVKRKAKKLQNLSLFQKKLGITKTYLYNYDPLKPHFYIVKLGFTGVYIIFLISAQTIDCGHLLEPPRRGGSNEYPQPMFCAEI